MELHYSVISKKATRSGETSKTRKYWQPFKVISPSWYGSPGVPTWNYQAVHVYGKANVIINTENLKTIINTLTETHESSFKQPWKPEYKDSLLELIVGIEINITELQGKNKLS